MHASRLRLRVTEVLARLRRSLAALALFAAGSASAAQTAYTNPLLTSGNADPCIVPDNNGNYYLYTTGDNKTYKYHSSTNLVSWSSKNTTIWTPGDGTINVWAPDVRWDPALGKYVMMATKDFNIMAATGTSLTSAFTTVSTTQFPIKTGAIDPFLFRDWDGKYYLYYAQWSNYGGWTEIMGRELPTSTSWSGVQNVHRVMIRYSSPSEGENPGYKPLVEGPEVWRDRDTYYMIYSNADWASPNYRECYATAKHPMGPWVKATNNPLIVRNDAKGIYGPGHGGNFTDAGGRLWHMYQQRPDSTTSGSSKRQMCIDRLIMDPVTRLLTLTPTRGTSVADGPITFPGNAMPTCTITAPAYGTVVSPGASVNFAVNATDSNGTIAKVEFYVDNTLVLTDTTSPYSYTWTATTGTHWFEAVATDNTGAVVKADAVKLIVGNQQPVVSVVRPIPLYVGYDRPEYLQVDASDPDGTVTKVDFYADGVLVATDSTAPYSCTYTVPTQGYVRFKAIATDNQGLTGETEWAVHPWGKSAQTPYKGIKSIPGTIEAEDFDATADPANPTSTTPDPQFNAAGTHSNPGNSVCHFKYIDGWSGASNYRVNTRVTLPVTLDSSGAYDMSEIDNADWYEYTCNVATAGFYDLTLRGNIASSANKILVTSDGVPLQVGGFASLPTTSGYQDVVLGGLYFPTAGQQRLRLNFSTTANKTMKLNRLTFAASTSQLYSIAGTVTLTGTGLSGVTVSDGLRNTVTDNNGNYLLTGIPDGSYTLAASKSGYAFTPSSLSVTVAGVGVSGRNFTATLLALVLTLNQTASLPVGGFSSYQIQASGSPTSYTLTSGTLPAGLSFSATTGVISGTPTTLGSANLTFNATNSAGTGASESVTMQVIPALIIAEPFAYAIGTNSPDPDAGLNGGFGLPAVNVGGNPSGTSTGLRSTWGTTTDVVAGLAYTQGTKTFNTTGGAGRVNNATWGGQVYVYRSMNTDPFIAHRVEGSVAGNFGRPGTSLYVGLLGQTSSSTDSAFRLSFKYDNVANFYLSNTATGWSLNGTTASGAALALNTPTLFVLRFDFGDANTTSVKLWVNPPLGQTLGTPTATVNGLTFPGLSNFQTNATVAGAMTLDEFRVGLTAESVTPFSNSGSTVPTAPTGLGATANSETQITLGWTDNATDETGYKIERSPNGSSGWTQIAALGVNATSHADSGLTAGTAYYYRIRATNTVGDSGYSNTANATTNAASTAPSAPSGLSATANSSTQITLAWTDNATNETGFDLERSPDGSTDWTQIATPGANATGYIDTGLSANTAYYYRVLATNAAGDSAYSNIANTSTPAQPVPVVTASQSASGTVNTAFIYQVLASNSPTSYSLASGTMPAGVSLNPTTGVLSGTPTATGLYTPSITATNAGGTSPTVVVTITITAPSNGLIVAESFAYAVGTNNPDPDGGLNSGNGLPATNSGGSPSGTSTGLRGTWGTSTDVVAGLAYVQGTKTLATTGGAARINNADWGTATPPIYRSMTTNPFIAQRVGSTTTGNLGVDGASLYFSLLASTSSSTADAFRLSFRYDGSANFFLSNTTTGWSLNGTNATGAALALNTPTLLVLRFDYVAGANTTVRLWVNPTLGAALGTANATVTGVTFPGFSNFQTRSTVANAMTFDEVRIGTSFADVTPYTAPSATGVQTFRTSYGLAADGSQDLLTPAGDGVENLLKFAFNMIGNGEGQVASLATPNATTLTLASSVGLPFINIGAIAPDTGKLQITYLRRKSSASPAPGISYAVQFSNDLGLSDPWAVNAFSTESVTSLDATFERVTVTDSAATPAKRFVRVKVSAP